MQIPYDPDFDDQKATPQIDVQGFLDVFSPKVAFFFGLALAIGGLSTIGFIVLFFVLF